MELTERNIENLIKFALMFPAPLNPKESILHTLWKVISGEYSAPIKTKQENMKVARPIHKSESYI